MRSIGEFDHEDHATNFCGYLNGINIRTEVEDEGDEVMKVRGRYGSTMRKSLMRLGARSRSLELALTTLSISGLHKRVRHALRKKLRN